MYQWLFVIIALFALSGCKGGGSSDDSAPEGTETPVTSTPPSEQPTASGPGRPRTPPGEVPEGDTGREVDGYRVYNEAPDSAQLRLVRRGGPGILMLLINGTEEFIAAGEDRAITKSYPADTAMEIQVVEPPDNYGCEVDTETFTLSAGEEREVVATCTQKPLPTIPIITLAYSVEPGVINVAWDPSTHPIVASNEIAYELHVSIINQTGTTTITHVPAGQTQHTLTGVQPGQKYWISMRAIHDAQSQVSDFSQVVTILVPNSAPTRTTTPFHILQDADVTREETQWRVAASAFSTGPQTGDVLVLETQTSAIWAKVTTAYLDGAAYVISVEGADLDDLFASYELSIAGMQHQSTPAPIDPSTANTHSGDPSISRYKASTPSKAAGPCKSKYDREQEASYTIEMIRDFTPSLSVHRERSNGNDLLEFDASLTGRLGAQSIMKMNAAASYHIECSSNLFTLKGFIPIPVGPLWIRVPTETTLDMGVIADAGVTSKIDSTHASYMRFGGHISGSLNLDNYAYAVGNGVFAKHGAEHTLAEAPLGAKASYTATLEITQTLAATAFAAMEAQLGAGMLLAATAVPLNSLQYDLVGQPFIVDKLDVDLDGAVSVSAGLKNPFSGKVAASMQHTLFERTAPVYRLPTICASGEEGCRRTIDLKPAQEGNQYELGVTIENEDLQPVRWVVVPNGNGFLATPTPSGPESSAIFTTHDNDSYLIGASVTPWGLGGAARQYVFFNVPSEKCNYGMSAQATIEDKQYWIDELRGFKWPDGYTPGRGVDKEGNPTVSTGYTEQCRISDGPSTFTATFFNGELDGYLYGDEATERAFFTGGELREYRYRAFYAQASDPVQQEYVTLTFGDMVGEDTPQLLSEKREKSGFDYVVDTWAQRVITLSSVLTETGEERSRVGTYTNSAITGYRDEELTLWPYKGKNLDFPYQVPVTEGAYERNSTIVDTGDRWDYALRDEQGSIYGETCGYHGSHEGPHSENGILVRSAIPKSGDHYFCITGGQAPAPVTEE